MREPPKLDTGTALNLVVSAWSLTWTGIALLLLGALLFLESQYVTFDKEAQRYISEVALRPPLFGRTTITTLELQQWMLMLFGGSLMATGLAIAPLYQKDESAAALAPEAEAGAS